MSRIIYKAVCLINNKIYIGQTKCLSKRIKEHIRSAKKGNTNSVFHKAISKYGIDNFKFEEVYNGDDDIDNIEAYFIRYYCSYFKNGFGYNMSFGAANKGFNHSEAYKLQLSKRMKNNSYAKGRKLTDIDKERLRLARLKNPICETSKLKMNDDKLNLNIFTFINKDIVFSGNMRDFSKLYKLNRSNITKLCSGKLKTLHGWKVLTT